MFILLTSCYGFHDKLFIEGTVLFVLIATIHAKQFTDWTNCYENPLLHQFSFHPRWRHNPGDTPIVYWLIDAALKWWNRVLSSTGSLTRRSNHKIGSYRLPAHGRGTKKNLFRCSLLILNWNSNEVWSN